MYIRVKILSNLLIETIKISPSKKGGVNKNFLGHKVKEIGVPSKNFTGISITLYGKYVKEKALHFEHFTTFNEWYEEEVKKCREECNKKITLTETKNVEEMIPTSNNLEVLICGVKFSFNKEEVLKGILSSQLKMVG